MAFGFDPSIILSATKTHEPTLNETLQTLSGLRSQATQRQQAEATLADMMRQRQQEASLADIYRQSAASPEALPGALMRGGFGAQSLAAENQAGRTDALRAQQAKLFQEARAAQLKQVGELFANVQDQDGWDMALSMVPEYYRDAIGAQYDAKKAQGLAGLGIPSEKRALLEQRDEELAARTADQTARRQESQAWREQQRATSAARLDAKAADRAAKEAKDSGKAAARAYLEGYELAEEAQPTPAEATAIRNAQANSRTMTETIAELQALYKKHGNSPLPGPVKARMSALATDLMLAAKGDDMYQLGVIAGPDMEILNRVVTDPTSQSATIFDFIGDNQSMERLSTLGNQVQRRFANKARALGFRPKAGRAAPAKASPAKSAARPAAPKAAAGGLTPEEAKELAELEAQFGGGR